MYVDFRCKVASHSIKHLGNAAWRRKEGRKDNDFYPPCGKNNTVTKHSKPSSNCTHHCTIKKCIYMFLVIPAINTLFTFTDGLFLCDLQTECLYVI